MSNTTQTERRAEADAMIARSNASDDAACAARAAANDVAIAAQHARMKAEGSDTASMAAMAGTPSLDPAPRQAEHTAAPSFEGHALSRVPGAK